jgi:GNAT superfamily N-acetyltransferase
MEIRAMDADAIKALAVISEQVGWGDLRPHFGYYVGRPDCYPVAAVEDGQVIGTGVGLRRGAVGWVGMITVREEHRGRGVGMTITRQVVELLEGAGCRSLLLMATDAGRPLYEKLHFETVAHYASFEGPSLGYLPRHARLRPTMVREMAGVKALDLAATGEDRSLDIDGCGRAGWVMVDPQTGEPAAYYLSTLWGEGPMIARVPDDGRVLLDLTRALAGQAGSRTAWTVLPEENHDGRRILEQAGFTQVKRTPRMLRGEPVAWKPEWIWGRFSGAMG